MHQAYKHLNTQHAYHMTTRPKSICDVQGATFPDNVTLVNNVPRTLAHSSDIAEQFYIKWPAPPLSFTLRDEEDEKRYRNIVRTAIRRIVCDVLIDSNKTPIFEVDGHALVLLAQMYTPQWLQSGAGNQMPLPNFGWRWPVAGTPYTIMSATYSQSRGTGVQQFHQERKALESRILSKFGCVLNSVLPSAGVHSVIVEYLRQIAAVDTDTLELGCTRSVISDYDLGMLQKDLELMAFDVAQWSFWMDGKKEYSEFTIPSTARQQYEMLQLFYFIEREDGDTDQLLDEVDGSAIFTSASDGEEERALLPGDYTRYTDKLQNGLSPAPCHSITMVTHDDFLKNIFKRKRSINMTHGCTLAIRTKQPICGWLNVYCVMSGVHTIHQGAYSRK